MSILIEDSEPS